MTSALKRIICVTIIFVLVIACASPAFATEAIALGGLEAAIASGIGVSITPPNMNLNDFSEAVASFFASTATILPSGIHVKKVDSPDNLQPSYEITVDSSYTNSVYEDIQQAKADGKIVEYQESDVNSGIKTLSNGLKLYQKITFVTASGSNYNLDTSQVLFNISPGETKSFMGAYVSLTRPSQKFIQYSLRYGNYSTTEKYEIGSNSNHIVFFYQSGNSVRLGIATSDLFFKTKINTDLKISELEEDAIKVNSGAISPSTVPPNQGYTFTIPADYLESVGITENLYSTEEDYEKINKAVTQAIIDGKVTPVGITDIPTVTPVNDGTIANTGYDTLREALSNISTGIQNTLRITSGAIRQALDAIKSVGITIAGTLEAILEGIQDIALSIEGIIESIINADITWFGDIVDSVKLPFMPILNTFKQGVSIWHYVVEWLQAISAPFQLFFGVMVGTGSVFVTPIYACIAGTIVLAIYKRFGR